jgi:hypothetical protein
MGELVACDSDDNMILRFGKTKGLGGEHGDTCMSESGILKGLMNITDRIRANAIYVKTLGRTPQETGFSGCCVMFT